MKATPPRLAQRFFCWYCRNQLRDSILGDLEEQFYQNQKKFGSYRAKLIYYADVFLFINRFTLSRADSGVNKYHHTPGFMFKNNLINFYRFIGRNKSLQFINIFGLLVGFSSFIAILFYINHELSYDEFHQNKSRIYRVNFSYADSEGSITTLVNSPPALATGIAGKFPELERISRLRYAMNLELSNKEIQFYEDQGYFADSTFLDILKFKLIAGDELTALDQPNSIVITQELARKYFHELDPIGRTLVLNRTIPLQVTGVLDEIPTNSHLNFDFLISFSTYEVPEGYSSDLTSWSWLGFYTYVELREGSSPMQFETKLRRHFAELDPGDPTPMIPVVQSLTDIYLGSNNMTDDLGSHIRTGSRTNINSLMSIAILILIIAGFNFANLTNALSFKRSKSIAMRKVLGAENRAIVLQLMTESILLVYLCLLISVVVVISVFPIISDFMGWAFFPEWTEILKLSPIILIAATSIGIMSGIYPALALVRYSPIKALKGVLKLKDKSSLSLNGILIMIQLAISAGLISATIGMSQQIQYLRSKSTGYSAENIALVRMLPEDMTNYYEAFKEKLKQSSEIVDISRSDRVVGEAWPWSIIVRADEDEENGKRVFFNLVDYDFFETLGIKLVQGRSFSKDYANDFVRAIVINQSAADYLGLKDPVGAEVHFMDLEGPRTVVGVMQDFNYTSLHHPIGPAVVVLPTIELEYCYVRFAPGDLSSQISWMESTWKDVSGGTPLVWRFLDDRLNQLYQSEAKISTLIKVFTILAILLACLGLYGIITFMLNNRIKEIGVRKILGASVVSLYILFVRNYFAQVFVAMCIMAPIIHYLLHNWMSGFAYHIQINALIYPLSSLILLVLILITVSFQIIQAIVVNPAWLLRNE